MSKNPKRSPSCEELACGAIVNQRNRWFTGKFMTARAYRIEQYHFLSHRWLHNRMLHGWGIVHGLKVEKHPDPECANEWVVVRCGMAIDCCGRELLFPDDKPFHLPPFDLDDTGEPADDGKPRDDDEVEEAAEKSPWQEPHSSVIHETGQDDDYPNDDEPPHSEPEEPWLLCLRYHECEIEKVPALQAEGDCDPQRSEANFVVQSAVVEAAPISAFPDDCWLVSGGGDEPDCVDDCDEDHAAPSGACLDPVCPCGTCVPLALLVPSDPERGWEAGFEIDLDGRRTLATPATKLTHVAAINWPHGGELTLDELRDDLAGELVIHFDRRLQPAEGYATGINEHTFTVQYGGAQQDIEFLSSNDELGPTLEDDCRAVFEIAPSLLKGKRTIAENTVYVTLKCDFILDCHGNPVDGDHLRGRLPSGDGISGGTFESWFSVVSNRNGKEKKK